MFPPTILMTILAQAGNGGGGGGGSMLVFLVPLIGILFLWQILIKGPQQKDQARRDEMLKGLKKNDPVVTIGGIFGTVVSVSEDGSEVVVRVDEGTRLKFRRDAIRDVIRKDETAEEPKT